MLKMFQSGKHVLRYLGEVIITEIDHLKRCVRLDFSCWLVNYISLILQVIRVDVRKMNDSWN